MLSTILLVFLGSSSLVLAGYPDTFSAGYGFISQGGFGPHGHYLPAVARVKVHKDPFQSHYSLDEEGPTHYKYVRQSSSNHHAHALIHHPAPLVHHHAALPVAIGVGHHGGGGHHLPGHHVGVGHHGIGAVSYANPHLYGGYGDGAIGGVGGYPHAVGGGYGGIY